jgi:WD40 repeat-containing protein SMU1
MLHANPISSLGLSRDNEILASGDLKGHVKVWRIQNGKCLKKFDAFQTYVSKIIFGKDISHLIVASQII